MREEIRSSKLAELYDYWHGKRPSPERLPSRGCLDPLDIPALLPSLMLIEMGAQPEEMRFRLIGTRIVERVGRDLTGHRLSEGFWGPLTAHYIARYWTIFRAGAAVVSMRDLLGSGGKRHIYEQVLLPLEPDDRYRGMLLAGLDFLD